MTFPKKLIVMLTLFILFMLVGCNSGGPITYEKFETIIVDKCDSCVKVHWSGKIKSVESCEATVVVRVGDFGAWRKVNIQLSEGMNYKNGKVAFPESEFNPEQDELHLMVSFW